MNAFLCRSVMFDHMEIPLHYSYGSKDYWKARRSMRYNTELYQIANKFRKTYLKSSDVDDNTELPHDWTKETVFLLNISTDFCRRTNVPCTSLKL